MRAADGPVGGEATIRSGAISARSAQTQVTSASASSEPTSWKCTWSTGSPCALDSASAIESKTASASARTVSGSGIAPILSRTSASVVWWW